MPGGWLVKYKDFDIGGEYRGERGRFNMWRYLAKVKERAIRNRFCESGPAPKATAVSKTLLGRGVGDHSARRLWRLVP